MGSLCNLTHAGEMDLWAFSRLIDKKTLSDLELTNMILNRVLCHDIFVTNK